MFECFYSKIKFDIEVWCEFTKPTGNITLEWIQSKIEAKLDENRISFDQFEVWRQKQLC
jgi:hypothetical protein